MSCFGHRNTFFDINEHRIAAYKLCHNAKEILAVQEGELQSTPATDDRLSEEEDYFASRNPNRCTEEEPSDDDAE